MPLSITTAGRDVAGSMRRREKEAFVLKMDLRLRSKREFRAEDHGQEEHFEEEEEEEEEEGDSD